MSETQNGYEQEYPTEEAPMLCHGESPLQIDVSEYEACQRYVHFKLLKQIVKPLVTWDDNQTKRVVTIYYYEDPILDQDNDANNIPKRGIVVKGNHYIS